MISKGIIIGVVALIIIVIGVFIFASGDNSSSDIGSNALDGKKVSLRGLSEEERLIGAITEYQCVLASFGEDDRPGAAKNREVAIEKFDKYGFTGEEGQALSIELENDQDFLQRLSEAQVELCPEYFG